MGKRLLLAACLAGLAWAANAAPTPVPLVVPGEPAAAAPQSAPRLRLAPSKSTRAHVELPDISAAALDAVARANARERAAHAPQAVARRVVIGVEQAAPAGAVQAQALAWSRVEGGFAAQVTLRSPHARALRLAIALAGVPAQAQMVFFGSADPTRLEGPVRVDVIADRTTPWWGPVTEGDSQTVEFFVPLGHDPARAAPRVVRASHLVASPAAGEAKRLQDIGRAGSCNVDVPCSGLAAEAGFRNAAASVAKMVFNDGAYSAMCSGALLADADPATQVPYFYSANHCFENASPPYKTREQMQAVARTLTTLWGFEADRCGSGQPSGAWTQLSGGATVLHHDPASDALLLRLADAPPAGAWFSGWDAGALAPGTAVASMHHPQGDLKKVSEGVVQRFSNPGVGGGETAYVEVVWSRGTTEGGSSGGGLWTRAGSQWLLRGGLWGGTAACGNPSGADYYSRFDRAYSSLAAWLGTKGSAIDYTDLWWNPAESGWGLNLIQHPSRTIFGAWYTYAADGKATWYVLPGGSWTSSNTYSGPLYAASGPHLAQAFERSKVQVSPVGTATLTFSDADHGVFAWTVNGVSGSRAITRQPF